MRINADFSRRSVVTPSQYHWVASPQGGVERLMLDRVGVEAARATSIVRYAPDAWFPHHFHPGAEEILVLSGIFSEGETHYPAGWYLRSPPGCGHQPSSREGALIFVKLWSSSVAEASWRGRFVGIASEWSPNFSGYVAGAIEAARLGLALILPDLFQRSLAQRL